MQVKIKKQTNKQAETGRTKAKYMTGQSMYIDLDLPSISHFKVGLDTLTCRDWASEPWERSEMIR